MSRYSNLFYLCIWHFEVGSKVVISVFESTQYQKCHVLYLYQEIVDSRLEFIDSCLVSEQDMVNPVSEYPYPA